MEIIKEFFSELDRSWRLPVAERIPLRVIGSAALMLQAGYQRGTKDSDILETSALTPEISRELLALAGKGSVLAIQHRLYLDIVKEAIPFLPPTPVFQPVVSLVSLRNFEVSALDVVDVVISKLKRFNPNDAADIRAMTEKGLVLHKLLVARFQLAVDAYSMDARAEDMPKYIKNLNTVERDFLEAPESKIALPDWLHQD